MKRHGFPLMRLERIFLSHLHGDHLFGIFGLLSTLSMSGRTEPLHIYAPQGFQEILDFFQAHFLERDTYPVLYHVVEGDGPHVILEDEDLSVTAIPLMHRVPDYGYVFREQVPELNVRKELVTDLGMTVNEILLLKSGKDVPRADGTVLRAEDCTYRPYSPRSMAYCSDTAVFDRLPQWVAGVDLLYHEATFADDCAGKAAEMFHSTARDAAATALKAGAGKLVIGHFSSRYKNPEVLLEQAREIFPETELASEGRIFEVRMKKYENR